MNLTINQTTEGNTLTVSISGKLDTATSPQLESFFQENLDTVQKLQINCQGLEYISSAGLRVILKVYKKMTARNGMELTNVNENVMEIFEITGFSDFLIIR